MLTEETGELPEVAEDGTMAYTATPLTGDVLDLPVTIQNLQLCTLLQERLGVKVTKVSYPLGCSTETGSASFWSAETTLDGYPDSIADRPAKIGKGINVRLRDDAWVDLVVTGDDAKAMAERIVPLLPR
ncbi:hypothetical protein [Actinokineospora alba]|uniref:hypothetical protein n=1 Tax=Actinokineospora alba TaxID=504798 RepID=UPI001061AC5D|nr:hypothetical protein [Actinokineospora alba]